MTFCTNFPAAHLVAPLEQETGIPIYDTVSIGVWDALRRAGVVTERGGRWGSLFTRQPETRLYPFGYAVECTADGLPAAVVPDPHRHSAGSRPASERL